MSCLEGIQIQGIRSFGPRDQDRGFLRFFSPLTLILGQNGCGKTTIIEALKYATTGDMPPGSGRGQSFIHDPKMTKEVTVKAQVKLVFTNVRGEKMIAQRIFVGTQKAQQVTVKTLDGTLSKEKRDGEMVSVNKKCADMEAEMFIALGVTKPILNHVIFCHQEESNWPLDEGKKLKERFDAIFDATEYLKCIKSMKDHVKTLRSAVLVKKEQAESARKDHTEAELLKSEINKQQERLTVSEEEVAKCKEAIDSLLSELRRLQKIEKEASTIEVEMARQETLLGEMRKNAASLEQSLRRPGCLQVSATVTEDELERMIQEMGSSVALKEHNAARDEDRLRALERWAAQQKETAAKLNVRLGKLESEEERLRKMRQERDELIRELCGRHGRGEPTAAGELTDRDVRSAVAFMQEALRKAQAEQENVAEEVSAAVDAAQARVNDARNEKTKLDSQLEHKRAQLTANHEEELDIQKRLVVARGSSNRLKELNANLANIDAKLNSVKKVLNDGELSARRKKSEVEISSLEAKVRELESERDSVLANLSAKKELSIHEESMNKKDAEIKRLMNKNADSFAVLGMTGLPRDQLSSHLASKCTSLQTALNKKDAELKQSQKHIHMLEVTEHHLRERAVQLERSLTEEQAKLSAALGGAELEVELTELGAQTADLEKQHGSLIAAQVLNERYVDKLRHAQPCPLCHREFDSRDEIDELVDELTRKIASLPREILEAEEKKIRAKERYDHLLTLRPGQERMQKLRDSELPAARAELERTQAELAEAQHVHAVLQREVQEADRVRRLAEELRTDVSRIDERERDVRRLRADVERLRALLSARVTERSAEELGAELDAGRAAAEQARIRQRDVDARLHKHRDELQLLVDERDAAARERLRLETLQAERTQLERRASELERASHALRTESAVLEEDAIQLEVCLREAIVGRERTASGGRAREEEARGRVEEVRAGLARLDGANDALRAYERDSRPQELMSVRQQLRELADTVREKDDEMTRLRAGIDAIRGELRSQESRQRDLEENKKLRRKRAEEERLVLTIAELKEKLEGYDAASVRTERRRLEVEHTRLTQIVFREDGAQKQIREMIRSRNDKLNRDQFKNAGAVYRERGLELACHSLAMKDLHTYTKALDDAIIRFHSKRMERINMIVRELWRATYRGNDIDYIEIKTDQSTGDATRRTTYNYRLVMVKQRTELEMRGRCSAGQKVLASLIIRLALAETFGVNCGMLALDEPTTNLDRDNIHSLAQALQEIVRKRAVQKNFQLVIITHDEDFLDVLGRLDYVDRYYAVSRNETGLSCITKRKLSGM